MSVLEVTAGGLLAGAFLVPSALAFGLAAHHGRYLPLWLPQVGTIAAYLAYAGVERMGLPAAGVVPVAIAAAVAFSLAIHAGLFAGDVRRGDPYGALIKGLAIVVAVEAAIGWATGGYALSFERLAPAGQAFIGWPLNRTLRWPDLVTVGFDVLATGAIAWTIARTSWGLRYRAIASNRALGEEYGIPARRIDLAVIAFAAALCAVGGILYGLRYGLAPQMLMAPTLKITAAAVAAGPHRLVTAALAVLGIGALEANCQASPSFSAFEHGVSFAVLAAALVAQHVLGPRLQARRNAAAFRAEAAAAGAPG